MEAVFAIDPGDTQSGFCLFKRGAVLSSGVTDNIDMLDLIKVDAFDVLAIEMIASYGMPVGKTVFDTCVWVGRFMQCAKRPGQVVLIYRKDVKLHLCGSFRAKDSNVRQAVLDQFPCTGGGKTPQIGTKDRPGPLYGVSSHAWSALAVAMTATYHLGLDKAA